MLWQTTRFSVDLSCPKVMGIVNLTPDSFSDGGRWNDVSGALHHCEELLLQGAHILDLGAESTRPGALPVPTAVELQRLLPVLKQAVTLGVPVSVDTYKPEVMRAALDMGADIINDIWALRQPATSNCPAAEDVVTSHPNCGICLMHMHREPLSMQVMPMEGDVLSQVYQFLEQRIKDIKAKGTKNIRIILDPGIGFGKSPAQNLQLLARQGELLKLGYGVLSGWSRKSTLGQLTDEASSPFGMTELAQRRVVPSVTAALLAVQNGANVVRVHDVKETVQALKIWQAVQSAKVVE